MRTFKIGNIDVKALLKLFRPFDSINIDELGDTWHPAGGFVDESYFNNILTVQQFLDVDYDFKGLVAFKARVKDVTINYHSDKDEFELAGNEQKIKGIVEQLKVLNNYNSNGEGT